MDLTDTDHSDGYRSPVGVRNYLVEGVSGTGKTSVCDELQRRGYDAVHGDRELAFQGNPDTGGPTEGSKHEHHLWHVDLVQARVARRDAPVTFFCGGSRNFPAFVHLFDGVFVLDVDPDTLDRRLRERPEDEWGGRPAERELIARLHRTGSDIPAGAIVLDATAPVAHVVDEVVRLSEEMTQRAPGGSPG